MEQLPKKALLTPSEVAKFWSVSRATIYRWADIGKIKAIKKAGTLRIPRAEAEKINSESG